MSRTSEQMGQVQTRSESRIHDLAAFVERAAMTISRQPSSEALTELQSALEELKIAEETLHEQNTALTEALERAEAERRRYVELFELAPEGYCVTDSDGVIREVNRSMGDLLQANPAVTIGKPLMSFIPPESRKEVRGFIGRVVHQSPSGSPEFPLVWQTDFLLRHRSPITVSARCSVARNDEGRVVGIRWLFQNITERKRLEEAARLHQHKLEQAVREKTSELQDKVEELETFHDVVVERELRLMELEKKVQGLGREPLNGSSPP